MTAQLITGWRNRPKSATPKRDWAADPAFNGLNATNSARVSAAPKSTISLEQGTQASQDRNFAIRQASI